MLKSLKTKTATFSFAIIALISGFLFLNQGITGNVVMDNKYPFNMVSLIGLLLIACSIILGLYSIKKKKK